MLAKKISPIRKLSHLTLFTRMSASFDTLIPLQAAIFGCNRQIPFLIRPFNKIKLNHKPLIKFNLYWQCLKSLI